MKGRKSKVEWSGPNNRRGIGHLLVALCGHCSRVPVCSLLESNSGHWSASAMNDLGANDPKRHFKELLHV